MPVNPNHRLGIRDRNTWAANATPEHIFAKLDEARTNLDAAQKDVEWLEGLRDGRYKPIADRVAAVRQVLICKGISPRFSGPDQNLVLSLEDAEKLVFLLAAEDSTTQEPQP